MVQPSLFEFNCRRRAVSRYFDGSVEDVGEAAIARGIVKFYVGGYGKAVFTTFLVHMFERTCVNRRRSNKTEHRLFSFLFCFVKIDAEDVPVCEGAVGRYCEVGGEAFKEAAPFREAVCLSLYVHVLQGFEVENDYAAL